MLRLWEAAKEKLSIGEVLERKYNFIIGNCTIYPWPHTYIQAKQNRRRNLWNTASICEESAWKKTQVGLKKRFNISQTLQKTATYSEAFWQSCKVKNENSLRKKVCVCVYIYALVFLLSKGKKELLWEYTLYYYNKLKLQSCHEVLWGTQSTYWGFVWKD